MTLQFAIKPPGRRNIHIISNRYSHRLKKLLLLVISEFHDVGAMQWNSGKWTEAGVLQLSMLGRPWSGENAELAHISGDHALVSIMPGNL